MAGAEEVAEGDPAVRSRGLNLLLGSAGVVAAALAWRALSGAVAADAGWSSMAARLGTASLALLPSVAALWLMVAVQMAARLVSGATDPVRGQDGLFLRVNQRAIGNTVEQMTIFVPALLALAAGVPGGRMPEVIALALTFAAARMVFWLGYLARPVLRAPGMAASFACASAALIAAGIAWLD